MTNSTEESGYPAFDDVERYRHEVVIRKLDEIKEQFDKKEKPVLPVYVALDVIRAFHMAMETKLGTCQKITDTLALRKMSGLGLKESKEACERAFNY